MHENLNKLKIGITNLIKLCEIKLEISIFIKQLTSIGCKLSLNI